MKSINLNLGIDTADSCCDTWTAGIPVAGVANSVGVLGIDVLNQTKSASNIIIFITKCLRIMAMWGHAADVTGPEMWACDTVDTILGHHLSIWRKLSALNHSTILAPPPKKMVLNRRRLSFASLPTVWIPCTGIRIKEWERPVTYRYKMGWDTRQLGEDKIKRHK